MPKLERIRVGDALPERVHVPDTVQLFLYNAAIWNPHRIHYDQGYATQAEGHPALVVDGPLQGDWLVQLVLEWAAADAELVRFRYANRRAAYVGQSLRAVGAVRNVDPGAREVRVELALVNQRGETVTPGEACLRFGPEPG